MYIYYCEYVQWMTVCQKVPKSDFCYFKNYTNLSDFFFQLKWIQSLGSHFWLKCSLITSIFETFYLLKSCPIFDGLSFIAFTKYNDFLWVLHIMIFGQKILLFRTHHQWYFLTELTLIVWTSAILKKCPLYI